MCARPAFLEFGTGSGIRPLGILASEQQRVFEPFFRGSNINEIGGLGLGLAIARDSVEACEGTISLESVPDHGTTVKLPQKI